MRTQLCSLTFCLVAALCSCSSESITSREGDFVIAGRKAHGNEVIRKAATGGMLLQRELRLMDATGAMTDVVKVLAEIEADGDVRGASVRWEGTRGRRYVELRKRADGARELVSRGNDEVVSLPAGRIHLVELGDLQQGTFAIEIELAQAAVRGARTLAEPAGLRELAPEPFIESTAPVVKDWCKQQSAEADPIKAAQAFAAAIVPKLAPDREGPASALYTVLSGGWDEGGSALLVACLRAGGHAARVVSGTVDGVPRTWAQVLDGPHLKDVDPIDALLPADAPRVRTATHVGFRDAFFSARVR
jgi:hypothetical protein